ncbi:zinc transporter 2-like isoform X1 [Trichogramma pretiosum]|uniref:zinc transporter 2-like isoform X1 n=1 Tax=Trichogramma pretiosum TaxID=7493 RepID=UPI0006C95631|nr:zinc transporter 2-like isoform X1 [Trichogramma pretiosum]
MDNNEKKSPQQPEQQQQVALSEEPESKSTVSTQQLDNSFKNRSTHGYGTTNPDLSCERDEKDSSSKKVIFCVHGKLSGCCTFVKGGAGEDITSIDYRQNSISFEDHCHRDRTAEVDKKARKKLIIASILCVLFMILEIVGGVLSNSLAIATDAAHLLTDFASFMISLFSIWVSSRPATKKMPFGWYRAEVIGALTSVMMIWVVTGVLFYMAVMRIINQDFELEPEIMLISSGVGVLVNLIMGFSLHQHGHGHSHGHDHSHSHSHGHDNHGHDHGSKDKISNGSSMHALENGTASAGVTNKQRKKKEEENINVRAAFIHVLGDFIQSVGVFIAAIVIYFKPSWSIVDPICTFFFSALVILTTFAIIKDVVNVLMEGTPKGFDYSQVEQTFTKIDGVVKVHNLRIWALSLDKTALSAHLAIKPNTSPQEILRTATRSIHDEYDFFEMTLQIEEFNEKMETCEQCKPLKT